MSINDGSCRNIPPRAKHLSVGLVEPFRTICNPRLPKRSGVIADKSISHSTDRRNQDESECDGRFSGLCPHSTDRRNQDESECDGRFSGLYPHSTDRRNQDESECDGRFSGLYPHSADPPQTLHRHSHIKVSPSELVCSQVSTHTPPIVAIKMRASAMVGSQVSAHTPPILHRSSHIKMSPSELVGSQCNPRLPKRSGVIADKSISHSTDRRNQDESECDGRFSGLCPHSTDRRNQDESECDGRFSGLYPHSADPPQTLHRHSHIKVSPSELVCSQVSTHTPPIVAIKMRASAMVGSQVSAHTPPILHRSSHIKMSPSELVGSQACPCSRLPCPSTVVLAGIPPPSAKQAFCRFG
ncbi:hypothetical protein BX666DRAFT_2120859 [Dichotomocladium elegans]|nr:hypothetical protein BX666DRAFT_2120859 [Dichotomocladium elegans]